MPGPATNSQRVSGFDSIKRLINAEDFTFKMILNESGALLFPKEAQHSSMKANGLSYEDDYKGNALAAMIRKGVIEIRYHRDFSDERVSRIVKGLLALPLMSFAKTFAVSYQGRPVQ